jgi:quinol-cytochrome oxidoreductase complex cytochrome b subunit
MPEQDRPSLLQNLKTVVSAIPVRLKEAIRVRMDERDRSRSIRRNFFLHIHSSRIHKFSLKPNYTLGLGLISFFLFLILIFSGILLMVYYIPSVERAYGSILDITNIVIAGRFIRNLHRWAAHGMVITVILHMARVFYTGAYLENRGFNWVIGIILLLTTIFLSFSGYLLPWDQLAFWAVTIGSNIAGSASELTDALGITNYFDPGKLIKYLLIGGQTVDQPALIRFYLLHIIFLPLLAIVLIGLHFWRIRKDGGLSRPARADELIDREEKQLWDKNTGKQPVSGSHNILSWPVALWAEMAVFLLTLAVLLVISYFFDAPLREMANASVPENPAKSPWYFLGLQELISYSAFAGGLLVPLMLIIALMSIPYLDRESEHLGVWFSGSQGRKISQQTFVISVIATIGLLALTVKFGWLKDWFKEIPLILIIIINPATLLALIYAGWSLWVFKKTHSTRLAGIALFTGCLIGFFILIAMGMWFRGPDWQFYWTPANWPNH